MFRHEYICSYPRAMGWTLLGKSNKCLMNFLFRQERSALRCAGSHEVNWGADMNAIQAREAITHRSKPYRISPLASMSSVASFSGGLQPPKTNKTRRS